jgi:hypothetical protein
VTTSLSRLAGPPKPSLREVPAVSSSYTFLHALHSGPMAVLALHMLGEITWCFFVLHFGCDLAQKFLGLFGARTCEKRI